MRRVTTVIVGIALCLLMIGVSVSLLTGHAFTRLLAGRFSLAAEAGLPHQRMLQVAEQVRAFVVDGDVHTLPATVDGRPGFDAGAVSHLRDVRGVLAGARVVTGALAALIALWIGMHVARRRTSGIADALRAGAIAGASVVVLSVVIAFVDFERFFAAFHGIFFKSGTWTFPSDSLLIQTFPEPFWVSAGATLGGLVLVFAAALWFTARFMDGVKRDVATPLPRAPEGPHA